MTNLLIDTLFASKWSNKHFVSLTNGNRMTYAQLETETCRTAGTLVSLGVSAGHRVAVQVDKSIEALVLYLATIRAGAVFVPLNTAYTPAEMEYLIDDAEPSLLVCRPQCETALRPLVEAIGAQLHTFDTNGLSGSWSALTRGPDEFESVDRSDNDLAAILYTSGTTGRAKGAMLSHRNLAANALTLVRCWQLNEEDVLLHALPIYHAHGLFVAINTVMVAGASMFFLPRFYVPELISLMPRATVLMGVPTFYMRLLNDPRLNSETTANMRLFVSGSAPLMAESHRAFQARTGHAILERYGMTETGMNTSNPCVGERRAGTVGLPLPGTEVRISDLDNGAPLPNGEVGILEIRGPNVFLGYWRMPEKTRAAFRDDGFFITGDMAFIDDTGYVTIVGRDKDLIISGGLNVYPKEVENEIDALPEVAESAVIGVPHPDFGEAVVAVVVPETDASLDESLVIARIDKRLARYKQPKKVAFVNELPRNSMGKVQKDLLRSQYNALYSEQKDVP